MRITLSNKRVGDDQNTAFVTSSFKKKKKGISLSKEKDRGNEECMTLATRGKSKSIKKFIIYDISR